MAKLGRKKLQVDAVLVEKLAKLHLSIQVIADCCEVSKQTIERRFGTQIDIWRSKGKTKIAEVLFDEGVNKRQAWALKMLAERHLGYDSISNEDNKKIVFELNYSKEKLEKGLKKNES